MANNASDKKSTQRRSRVAEKAKSALKDARSSYSKKMKEIRESKTPSALMNLGFTAMGAIPTAAVCGLLPDTYKAKMGETEYEVPSGAIAEGTAAIVGALGTVGSAVMGWEGGIHALGGVLTMGTGLLVRRGTRWGVDQAWTAYNNENNAGATQPQAPAAAAGGY